MLLSRAHPVDQSDIPGTIDELLAAGVTTAVLNLTIDDCDWTRESDKCTTILQNDTDWRVRFNERRKALDPLVTSGRVLIVKQLSDIPISRKAVRAARRDRRIAIIVASEGSNQFEAPRLIDTQSPRDDAASKSISIRSIRDLRADGWLSTALIHVIGDHGEEKGHRLLSPDGQSLNDFGRFTALTLLTSRILLDLPHLPMRMRDELLDIADLTGRPVMISHDNPLWLLQDPSGPKTMARIASSGGGTGTFGVHSYKDYVTPTLEAYAALIDKSSKALDQLPAQAGQRICGNRHLALGLDWFNKANLNKHEWAGRSPDEPLKGLVSLLMAPPYNYADEEIRNILGLNMFRILQAAWK